MLMQGPSTVVQLPRQVGCHSYLPSNSVAATYATRHTHRKVCHTYCYTQQYDG